MLRSVALSAVLSAAALVPACASAQRPAKVVSTQAAQQGLHLSILPIQDATKVPKGVTALYVVVHNRSTKDVVVSPDDFAVGTPGGAYQSSLLPHVLAGSLSAAPVGSFPGRVVRARHFGASRWLRPLPRQLSAEQLVSVSLPMVTLRPGGSISGYLFFPPGQGAELRWQPQQVGGAPVALTVPGNQ